MIQANLIEWMRRFRGNGRKTGLTLLGLLLITLAHAQCPSGCNVDVGVRSIWQPGRIASDVNWGFNPWGAHKTWSKRDPEFDENGGIWPNNDWQMIAGYDFVANASTWCPTYNDKRFYIDPANNNFTRPFTIPAYKTSKISETTPIDERYSKLGIIFTTSTTWNTPCAPQPLTITPKLSDVGTSTRIYEVLYGHENASTFCGDHYNLLTSFSYTVETPQWKPSAAKFKRMCQDDNTNYYLYDYFSVDYPTFNLDGVKDTVWWYPDFPNLTHDYQLETGLYTTNTVYQQLPDGSWGFVEDTVWQYPDWPNYTHDYQLANNMYLVRATPLYSLNPHNISPGVHTLYAIKSYDNGADDPNFGSRKADVWFPYTITILPPAPTVGNVSATPSCPGAPNGTIAITGVTGGDGNYRYILRNGLGNTDACDPNAGSCFNVAASGSFSGSDFTITGVGDGDYTLWVANGGATTGDCAKTFNITIGRLSVMDTLPITIQHISCPGGNNGLVKITDTGGLAPYTFTLTSPAGTITNNTGEFSSLLSGSYVMNTKDGCDHAVQRTIVLTEPLPVNITATASATDCNTPANGAIDVTASGGSGTFDYYLYDSTGALVLQQLASTATTWSLPAMGAGKYTATVYNTAATGCTAATKNVVIAGPPPLTISYTSQVDNKCSYDALGAVQLSAGGGQANGYIFFLQNMATGQVQQAASGSFSSLPAASYKAWVRNRDLSCNDSAIYAATIVIAAPPALQAVASAADITCNGDGDGTVTAIVSGGTPAYALQWQQWNDMTASWSSMSGKVAASATSLQKGSYRLQVTDVNGCTASSNKVDIGEPVTLTITSVDRHDIVCYGGTGSIQMNVTGGNTGYVYELSTDNGNSWSAFTATTALAAADYQLKVTDSKNCSTRYTQPVAVTAPAQPLAITYSLTDYNGFNVPCYGSTGVVNVNAAGGNGSSYTGYTFAVDNGTFAAAAVLSAGAGNHTFSVQDARGCVVSATATLTQPQSQMQTIVSNKVNNECVGGKAGEVTVLPNGGTPQYAFSINGIDYQSSPVFGQLLSGTYKINVHDMNGCADSVGVTIIDLNPPIVNHAAISNVLCYNGSDGSISLSPSGGVPMYSYAWKDHGSIQHVLTGLPTGKYYVTITDSKGCAVADSFTVAQPLHPLSAATYTRPVCVNNPYGNVQFYAQGGTSPYLYSIDGGNNFSNIPLISNVAAGSYPIEVKDANGCTWTGNASVVVNNINPTLSFLVSTRQNALDTLQVKEVCVPKPDSIQWTFDPQTVIIDNNMFNPLIRYNKEGSYWITMKAWFGGCDFNTSKQITINPYDPDVVNNYNNLYGIDTVIVAPNPNNGNFNLQVKLFRKQRLHVAVYTVTGAVLWNKEWDYTNLVQEPVSLPSNVANGLVFIKVLTDDDVRDVQMLIQR